MRKESSRAQAQKSCAQKLHGSRFESHQVVLYEWREVHYVTVDLGSVDKKQEQHLAAQDIFCGIMVGSC
jgi:hypothetical protein